MTWTDVALVLVAVFGYGCLLGWIAGARWRRAHDAARYAQIDQRRERAYLRRSEQLSKAIQVAAAAIEKRQTILIDREFAIEAFRNSGFEVTPILKPEEKH